MLKLSIFKSRGCGSMAKVFFQEEIRGSFKWSSAPADGLPM